ncbi:hypothetical protein [Clostridium estertheticum]|uniref:hypothetical protein n=1 Tax=Clostridium estertheticum TaxID=238834 RepID=UPI002DD43469|nr:hypothetical protein [Clostridium estertheticum]
MSFLKRISSELKSELSCDIIETLNMFYFGRPSKTSYKLEDTSDYKACKDLKQYHESGGSEAGHDTDYFYYEIETREKYEVGANINFKNKDFYVNQYKVRALSDEVIYKYRLCRKNGVWQTKVINSLIGGASIEGKVLEVKDEKIKLHLNIDKSQNKDKASWFPYAPPTGNVMYSMPIVGTSASLYFPSETSEDPIVTGCVRTNGSGCAKTADTTKRYFGTEHGSEIEMVPGALNIKGGSKEPLSISFDDAVGVTIKSHKKLSLNAAGGITMKTPQSVKLKAQSQILVAKAGTKSGFSMETDLHFLSNNVIKNGSDREAFAAFDDEPTVGKKPEPKPVKKAVVAIAAVAIAVTLGAATAVVAAIAIGAAVAGTAAVASQAISDVQSGEVSDITAYMKAGGREALVGALSGAIFGPFGMGEALGAKMIIGGLTNGVESLVRQTLEGKGINFKTLLLDAGIGAATAGVFHGAGKLFQKASPFVKNAFSKISSNISENTRIAKIALSNMEKGQKSVVLGSNFGNVDEALGRFTKEFKKVKSGITQEVSEAEIKLGKVELDAYRKELGVAERNTVAVGKTDIKGLEDMTFKGASPEVRNEAGLATLDDIAPNREFKAPYDHIKNPKLGQFTRHAEEGVLNELNDAIKYTGIKPEDVTGNLYIHQSNPGGVCNKCTKGLINIFPEEKCGIFYQASVKYPSLNIMVTSEIDDSINANGLISFVLRNGKIIK